MTLWKKGCRGHPHIVPYEETAVAQAAGLFREENVELPDIGSLHLVAPASLEPRGTQSRTGSCVMGLCHVLCLAVGGKGSGAFPMTRLLRLFPLPLSLGLRVQLNAPLVLGSLDCWSKGGVKKMLLFL